MEKDYKTIWNNCLRIIQDNIEPKMFETWFMPIEPVKLEKQVLTLQVPSNFFYEYLEANYIDILKRVIRKELGDKARLEYSIVVAKNISPITSVLPSNNKSLTKNRPLNTPMVRGTNGERELPNPFVIPGIKKITVNSQLNDKYSFENYVEGECNRLARSAGFAVAQKPGTTAFNPLFIYSPVGLGKTHLVHAIGLETKKYHPDKTVLYVTAEQFAQQYSEACINRTVNDFIHFYQMVDVLIIDDVQFFSGKEKTQDTFFQIFNSLHSEGKQLIFTSDKAPVDLNGMETRIISRLKWGLTTDLQSPSVDTRIAILNQKLKNDGLYMDKEVIEYLAYHVNSNVREMEGILISLIAQSTLNKKNITVELAKQMIDKFVKNTSHEISIEFIQKVTADYFDISIEKMNSRTRKREITQARQIAMYFSKKLTTASLTIIGQECGKRDHATVLHACKTVSNLYETDKQYRSWVDEIEHQLHQ